MLLYAFAVLTLLISPLLGTNSESYRPAQSTMNVPAHQKKSSFQKNKLKTKKKVRFAKEPEIRTFDADKSIYEEREHGSWYYKFARMMKSIKKKISTTLDIAKIKTLSILHKCKAALLRKTT